VFSDVVRAHSHLKEEVLDSTMWTARFGKGFGPLNEWTCLHIRQHCNVLYKTFLVSDFHTISGSTLYLALMLLSTLFVIVMYIAAESRCANGKLVCRQREASRDGNWCQACSTKFWSTIRRTVLWCHVAYRMSRINVFEVSPTNFKKYSGILP
jgi:hypothetical protein